MQHKGDEIMDVKKLMYHMEKNGITKDDLAKALKVDRATIYRRFAKNGDSFTVFEVNQIKNALGLSEKEATSIFFNH